MNKSLENSYSSNRRLRVAVLGNPNTGKSTLFNQLTGIRQQTANYPRVTVEHHLGQIQFEGTTVELIDLPGTYSLTPRSPEEVVAVDVLLGTGPVSSPPDLILCVVDASNLERNLFLISQVLDLNRPTIVAVNMLDVAKGQGDQIDLESLSSRLGVPTIGIQANKRSGIDGLVKAIVQNAWTPPKLRHDPFPSQWNQYLDELANVIKAKAAERGEKNLASYARFAAIRLLFDDDRYMLEHLQSKLGNELENLVCRERSQLLLDGSNLGEAESDLRYSWINKNICSCIHRNKAGQPTTSDKADRLLTHPIAGLLVAGLVLVCLFQAIFHISSFEWPLVGSVGDMIEVPLKFLKQLVGWTIPEGALHSLLTDGLISGVGGVLVFLPQILLLFLLLGILEDSGYLARAAFLMDRYLSRFGLSGLTLFPLLSSFACAIPGIMATRVISDRKERMITILIAPLMSCSARLPVYILLISAFVPEEANYLGGWLGLQGLVMMAMYLIGIVVAIGVAWALKKTMFKSKSSSFVMELPTYKVPNLRNIFQRMFEGGWAFVRDAGTLIVAMTILVWAAGYFPRAAELPTDLLIKKTALEAQLASKVELESKENVKTAEGNETKKKPDRISDEEAQVVDNKASDEEPEAIKELKNQIAGIEAGYQLKQSFLGRAGLAIEPIVKPLGWDWRIGSAAIASFPAREVVVATLGVIFGMGEELNEESNLLRDGLKQATWEGTDKKLITTPVALSIMVFFALCAQCVSTLGVIRRETNSWFWPTFTFVYMTVLAYIGALLTYQIGSVWN